MLNITYARLVRGLDQKQREELDDKLYGFDVTNQRAMQDLTRGEG